MVEHRKKLFIFIVSVLISLGIFVFSQKSRSDNTGTGHQAGLNGTVPHVFDGAVYRDVTGTTGGAINVSGTITSGTAAVTANAGDNGITADTTLDAATTNLRLMGLSMRESAATAAVATAIIRHGVESGGNCTGNEIAYIELNGDQSIQVQYQPRGIAAASGVCADVVAGTIDISTQTIVEAAP